MPRRPFALRLAHEKYLFYLTCTERFGRVLIDAIGIACPSHFLVALFVPLLLINATPSHQTEICSPIHAHLHQALTACNHYVSVPTTHTKIERRALWPHILRDRDAKLKKGNNMVWPVIHTLFDIYFQLGHAMPKPQRARAETEYID